ncbi:MAG: FAD-binding oxidoreductase [Rhodospirillaceae bacterium]|nr:FAD-binding oxidoreductase [Rhodospirillaceae bacterium]
MITQQTPAAFCDPLPDAVDVAIIGAGIAGTATAYFLARAGVSVLLCEKGRVAGEQSSRNWGWVRQQGRDEAELPIMIEANRLWRGLAKETGEPDLAFTPCGCVYVAPDPQKLAKFEGWCETARRHQLDTRMLTGDEVAELLPGVAGEWIGGMVTPSDGRSEPQTAVPALARAAKRLGVVIAENCAVRTLDLQGGRLAGIVTEQGRVRCGSVVLAGGAWSGAFAGNAGIEVPQLLVRATVMRTGPAPPVVGPNVSLAGLALRRRGDGGYTVATGLADHFVGPPSFRHALRFRKLLKRSARELRLLPAAPTGYPGAWGAARRWTADAETPFERVRVLDPVPSRPAIRRIRARLPEYVPALRDVGFAGAWAGMIDVTPDAVPVLGEVDAMPGLFVATGLSGHGFGIGPAVGRIAADMVQGRAPGQDLDRFRLRRFFDGSAIVPGPY